ncbi:MAG: type II toxin-antitoxin system RelE family toxin [Nocardioidaceae bacterium]
MGAGQGGSRPRVTYRIQIAPAALRQLRKLDRAAQRRVQAAIELLADEPHPSGAKKLVGGEGEWRVRTGDYRIVYGIHDEVLLVLVVAVDHRREIYRRR